VTIFSPKCEEQLLLSFSFSSAKIDAQIDWNPLVGENYEKLFTLQIRDGASETNIYMVHYMYVSFRKTYIRACNN